jgi:hypothetical protein
MATMNASQEELFADHPDLKVNESHPEVNEPSLGLTKRPSMIRNSNRNSKLNSSPQESNVKPTKPPYASTASAQIGECNPNTWPT